MRSWCLGLAAAWPLLVGCAEEPPDTEVVYETECEPAADIPTGCDPYDWCCTWSVTLEDGEEIDRFEDGCWYEHEQDLYDCLDPACSGAESDVQAAACGAATSR